MNSEIHELQTHITLTFLPSYISEGLKSLKWLNVKNMLFLNDALMVHRCLQGKPLSTSRKTRYSANLNFPLCRLTKGQRSFTYRGAKIFNSLSDDLRTVQCSNIFKDSEITNSILNNNFYTIFFHRLYLPAYYFPLFP